MDINKLIEDNMGLVYKQLHRFNLINNDDAFSFALEALSKAAQTYDDSKSVKFSTYATTCVYNAIAWYLRESARHSKYQPLSYDEPLTDDSSATFVDMFNTASSPESEYLTKELYEYLWRAFDKVYSELPNDTAKQIISAWKESSFTASQTEIANSLAVSQAHVSRALSAFKHKLKKEMEGYLCEK